MLRSVTSQNSRNFQSSLPSSGCVRRLPDQPQVEQLHGITRGACIFFNDCLLLRSSRILTWGAATITTYRHQHHSLYTYTPAEFTILRHLRHSRYMNTCSNTHSVETPVTFTVLRDTCSNHWTSTLAALTTYIPTHAPDVSLWFLHVSISDRWTRIAK